MENRDSGRLSEVFGWMFPRIEAFLNDTLSNEDVDDDLYVEGSHRIEFRAAQLRPDVHIDIEEYNPAQPGVRSNDFEEALFERLLQPRKFNLLVLLGGLGAGKSTTVKYLLRRFRDRSEMMRKTFQCACVTCFRRPIHIDFRSLGHHRALRQESIVPDVFRQMRLRTYERIIIEWLQRSNNNIQLIRRTDPDFLVLRRLLIANDLLLLHGGEYPGLARLYSPELALEAPLTSISMKDQDLLGLIRDHMRHAAAYDERIRDVSHDPDCSQDLMALTLRFYLDKCNAQNPTNLIILDNLDQLPTQHIEELLRELHDLATQAQNLPLLVPLRPSSINPYGFVRDILFRYHYGPDNFRVILSRLERHILTQSRDELRIPRTGTNDKPFPTAPQENEIDALLAVAYLYARIMATGQKKERRRRVKLHPDHQFLLSLTIGKGPLHNLAETSDALVGACCRYGLGLLWRFFANTYRSHPILDQAVRLRANYEAGRRIKLAYADVVINLLRDPIGSSQTNRVANLFEPTKVTSNWGWPTLVLRF